MKFLILVLMLLPMIGCTDAGCAKTVRYGNKYKIRLWSGGKVAMEWTSTGRVNEDDSGAGFYFVDALTDKLVRVQGDLSVEEIE